MKDPFPIAVLLSGSGSTLQNLIDRADEIGVRIVAVISSRPGVRGLERAEAAGIPTIIVERSAYANDHAFSSVVFSTCEGFGAKLICMAGWLRKIVVPDEWHGRVMNVHPSLLPSFGGAGMFGRHVHDAVLARGCRVTGCTVHLVDNNLDAGPILAQVAVPVEPGDDAATLAERVQSAERELYPTAIAAHVRNLV